MNKNKVVTKKDFKYFNPEFDGYLFKTSDGLLAKTYKYYALNGSHPNSNEFRYQLVEVSNTYPKVYTYRVTYNRNKG